MEVLRINNSQQENAAEPETVAPQPSGRRFSCHRQCTACKPLDFRAVRSSWAGCAEAENAAEEAPEALQPPKPATTARKRRACDDADTVPTSTKRTRTAKKRERPVAEAAAQDTVSSLTRTWSTTFQCSLL